ncbi:MAG: DgaE family pyridoxal phosphate-dependent ammonia lyase [Turicibacter sp.]|nr:DgaE family pyridoxal phosphate-dependent ammonia lyase [Turicibacter sp.]
MKEINEKLGLKQVINASGKMTALGVSKVSDEVAAMQKMAGQSFFIMDELMVASGAYVAELLQVEDAQITSSASAGIVLSVAALIGQGAFKHVYQPYCPGVTDVREVVVPKGHNVDYGAPVELMIAQGGGVVREAGYANVCTADHVRAAITDKTVAILYVKSHHTVQKSMLSVAEAVVVAREYGVPLIVDAAAEEDLFAYTRAGADLVIYSGGKALEGPSSGLVIGKKTYIDWIRLQNKGMGRAMKIGKENVLGLVAAIEAYLSDGPEDGASMQTRLAPFVAELDAIDGLTAEMVRDAAGRDIYRARVTVDAELTIDALAVIRAQQSGNPAIFTRDYQANNGIIEYDIRAVDEAEMSTIIARLCEIMAEQ